MKHLIAISGIALTLAVSSPMACAEASPPPLPALSPEQSQDTQARLEADAPPDYYEPRPPDRYAVEPAYGPAYRYGAPYDRGPHPYAYWGPSVCAGGFGHHFGGRICF